MRNYLFFFPSSFVIDHLFHHYIIRLSDDTILDLQHSIEKRLIPNSYNNFVLIGSKLVKAYEVGSRRIDAHICGDHITELYTKVCIDGSVGKRKRSKRILLFLLWPEILNH